MTIKAPRRAIASNRGKKQSALAPRKSSRSTSRSAPLAPGDPLATQRAVQPGPNGTGNTIVTDAFYQMGQEDQRVVVQQNAATVALPLQPLNGYPVFIVADGGIATVTGTIQGGNVSLQQGTIGIFVYSDESGEWSVSTGQGTNPGNTAIVTHATGAYEVAPGWAAMVDTTTGSIATITLSVGALGDTFEVSDEGCDASANNVTVAPSTGAQLEDPNAPGVYQAANVVCVFATNGQFCRWRSNGAGKYKIIGSGT